jgi:hypothetical protein
MVKPPRVSPDILQTLAQAREKAAQEAEPGAAKRKEAPPKSSLTAKESIRPARTSIAHQRGGNKGK